MSLFESVGDWRFAEGVERNLHQISVELKRLNDLKTDELNIMRKDYQLKEDSIAREKAGVDTESKENSNSRLIILLNNSISMLVELFDVDKTYKEKFDFVATMMGTSFEELESLGVVDRDEIDSFVKECNKSPLEEEDEYEQ